MAHAATISRVPPPARAGARLLRRCCLLLAWWALALGAAGAPVAGALDLGAGERHELSREFWFLQDPGGELALGDILQPPVQARFRPVPPGGPAANFGFTSAAVWLRIALQVPAQAAPDWLLEVAYPPLDLIELYVPHPELGYEQQLGGDLLPFGARAVPHHNHVFPVRLAPGRVNVLYLRLLSEGTVTAPVTLWRPARLWQHDQAEYGLLSMYFGLLVGLLLYNLLLFVSVRDIGYLHYVGFVGAMAVGQAALTGMGTQFLWPGLTWWNSVLPAVALSACALFGILFARDFLASAVRMPRVDRVMQLHFAGWVLTLLSGLTLPYTVSTWMVTVMALLSVATMLVAGVITVRRRFAGARLFFTAWAVLLAGVLVLTLHNAGVLPSNPLTANALLIGSALEMVLLSFALADRINVARRFKEKAQARIATERAMVGALSQAQDRLRLLLDERDAILNSMLVGIVLIADGRIQWLNRCFAQMLGAPAARLIGRLSVEFDGEPQGWEEFRRQAREAIAAEGVFTCERRLRRADGELFWVRMSGTCLRGRDPDSGVIWTLVEQPGEWPSARAVSAPLPAADPAHPG